MSTTDQAHPHPDDRMERPGAAAVRYRRAFLMTLAAFIVLAGVAAGLAYRLRTSALAGQGAAAPAGAAGHEPPGASGAVESSPPEEPALQPIQLSPQRLMSIGATLGTVEFKPVAQQIRSVGNVVVDERGLSTVQLRFAGWIRTVDVDATYDYVKQGQPLFTIYSPDLVTTEREYLVAKQNRDALASSQVPGVSAGAQAILDAAVTRLEQWNLPPREINRLESTGQVRDDLEIDAPATGYITERNVLPNMYVQPATRLYTVADLSTVWVIGEFFQSDIGQFRTGQSATVTTDAYPGRVFSGRVDRIYPQIDTTTRTGQVRFVFSNRDLTLTPGMFVNVTATIPMGRQLVLPASAVLHSGLRNLVFVDHGGGHFEPRDIDVGPRVGDDLVVLKGVRDGERIVTSADFLVDSESQLQAALGSFAPPPPGAGAAAQTGQVATVTLTTAPAPPQKGANTLRVEVKDQTGAAVIGAQVSVTFAMPAMPAMGMAAMREVANLTASGAGSYTGQLTLAAGGTWQVRIVARKDGRAIAQEQVSLTVTGGR